VIGHLRGRLVRKTPPALIVDVHGVGYELEAPMSTFYRLPEVGSEVELATHLVVREDAHLLYGFATEDERRLFRDLLRVTGIGPKIGLALLSGIDVDTFMRCVIGRKTAERLLVEMRDRIRALGQLPASVPVAGSVAGARAEAYAALVALGYRPVEVNRLLQGVDQEGAGTEELIRRALQAAAR
jgi:Holliday junction DNA helicase RuvA